MKIGLPTLLLILLVGCAQKPLPAPAPPPALSRDFQVTGRRALQAIDDLPVWAGVWPDRKPSDANSSRNLLDKLLLKTESAISEADVQRQNDVDKQAVELLRNYRNVALDLALDRWSQAYERQPGKKDRFETPSSYEVMYAICKKEAEQTFESGILVTSPQCRKPQ